MSETPPEEGDGPWEVEIPSGEVVGEVLKVEIAGPGWLYEAWIFNGMPKRLGSFKSRREAETAVLMEWERRLSNKNDDPDENRPKPF